MMIPMYNTKKFTDIWSEVGEFVYDYNNAGIPTTITEENINTLYYLLYARYGNSPIANNDENQFKYKVLSIIFQYGPTWEKRLEIQANLRNLTEDELRAGSKAIYNHSFNPSTAPSTATMEEFTTVNDQNTTNTKKGKAEAYGLLWDLLNTDITGPFIGRFKECFKQFVLNENPVLYISDEGEE